MILLTMLRKLAGFSAVFLTLLLTAGCTTLTVEEQTELGIPTHLQTLPGGQRV